jgi:hypothetical protein
MAFALVQAAADEPLFLYAKSRVVFILAHEVAVSLMNQKCEIKNIKFENSLS